MKFPLHLQWLEHLLRWYLHLEYLEEKKNRAIGLLEDFEENESNLVLIEKVDRVRNAISSLSQDVIDDNSIVKFLTITKLISELRSEEASNV